MQDLWPRQYNALELPRKVHHCVLGTVLAYRAVPKADAQEAVG